MLRGADVCERQSAATTKANTVALVHEEPHEARVAVWETLERYIEVRLLDAVVDDICSDSDKTVAFLLEHRHHVEASESNPRVYMSGLTIALGYFMGGLIPLLPYILFADGSFALACSVVVMVFTLFGFGVLKTALLGEHSWKVRTWEGVKMIALGGTAAAASVVCVRLVHE